VKTIRVKQHWWSRSRDLCKMSVLVLCVVRSSLKIKTTSQPVNQSMTLMSLRSTDCKLSSLWLWRSSLIFVLSLTHVFLIAPSLSQCATVRNIG